MAGSFQGMKGNGADSDLTAEPAFGLDVSVLEIVIDSGTVEERQKLAAELAELR